MSLERFIEAQELVFHQALTELRAGKKCSHWMWVIFPQLAGLGTSATSDFYAIKSLEDAAAYLAHPVLGLRLLRCVHAMMRNKGMALDEIFDFPDNLKFRSSMTLFSRVPNADLIFQAALDTFCGSEGDRPTLKLLTRLVLSDETRLTRKPQLMPLKLTAPILPGRMSA